MTVEIALAWLLEKDWPEWQEADRQLPEYARWRAKTEASEKTLKSKGIRAERIVVRPEQFSAWCAANVLEIGREARALYAAQILMNRRTAR
jgi:hypothetical protein